MTRARCAARTSMFLLPLLLTTACKLDSLPPGNTDAAPGASGGSDGGAVAGAGGGSARGTGGTGAGGGGGANGGGTGGGASGTGGGGSGTGGGASGTGGGASGTGGGASGTGGGGGGTGGGPPGSGGGPACDQGKTCTPAGGADACATYAIDCSAGTPVCLRFGNQPTGTACSGGVCSPAGTCAACSSGSDCTPAADPCKVGSLTCGTGQPVCAATAATLSDGTSCGTGRVCHSGVCGACVAGQACTPTQGKCVQGLTDCSTGLPVCTATNPVAAGQTCGTNQVCDGAGACAACAANASCAPANLCHAGALSCSTGAPACNDTGSALPDNVFCATGMLCAAGSCASAGNWITRGEDARTSTGGWVYTFAASGASIAPVTSNGASFPPSPGGISGNALAVSGTLPPQNPAQNIYPAAGLGWTFTDNGGSVNGGARGAGIQLYARSPAAMTLQVSAGDIWTDPSFPNCTTRAASDVVNSCYDFPQATCNLQPGTWTLCRFFWSDFKRPDFGNAGAYLPIDENGLTSVQLSIPSVPAGAAARNFQFAVDDVSFIPSGSKPPACASPLIIDDMEDGDGGICPTANRTGGWYVLKSTDVGPTDPAPNAVVTAKPIPNGGRQGSLQAMHFSGSGVPVSPAFALIAFSVNGMGPYDASSHKGLLVWARSGAGAERVRVNMVTSAALSTDYGGACVAAAGDAPCGDYWGTWLDLTASWQQYTIYFPTAISQIGWGKTVAKDLAHLLNIELEFQRDSTHTPANPSSFDYWLDDVQFFD